MYSNSSASSPDILGTPGDAEYLISSPIKPFNGRQSAMSPANFKLLQTPRTGSRPRASFTPGGRSAHSIRFDDVLLPASPSMKLDGGQMSLSPDKAQTDGNVSPWRIRVTLEATQDEDEMAVDSPRKRLRPVTTTTTKIPLKGEEAPVEETPRRRRGRPRKSDLVTQDATPIPGSPGHTPGPVGASGQKRKRGRPRKNTPVWDAAEAATGPGPQEVRMPGIQEVQEDQRVQELHDDQEKPMEDIHDTQETQGGQDIQEGWGGREIDQAAPIDEPQQSFSPLNMAADVDSDDDDLPDVQDFGAPLENPTPTQGYLGGAHENRSSPRVRFEQTFDTPHVDSPDEPYMVNGSGHWGSTPSKMPSPSHERNIISPDNTLHAGRTPMPPRTYPTPTSSLVDEEKRDSAPSASSENPTTNDNLRPDESHPTEDPTDEQREFDSIIESEGFSMVSLDTLPSAKQHGLDGKEDSKIGKSALRRVWNQDTIGSLQRRTSRDASDTVSSSRTRQSSKEPRTTRHSRQPSNRPGSSSAKPKPVKRLSPLVSPPATSVTKSIRKGPLSRLARMIRLGVALEGTMRHAYDSPDIMATPHIPNSGDQVSDMDASRKRMEILFSNFNPKMHHELRGAIRFGHELARRKRHAELETIRSRKATKSPMTDTPRAHERDSAHPSTTPLQQVNSNRRPQSPSTMMKRRMEEWQMEREAISREIQMANTSQVIVIGSDDSGPGNGQDGREPSVEQEQEPEFDRAAPFEALADPADDYSDDDYQYNDYQQDQNHDEYQDENQDQDQYQYHDQDQEDLDQYQDLHEEQHQQGHYNQSSAQGLDIMDDQYYRDLDLGEDKDDYERYRGLDLGPDSNDGEGDDGYHRDLDLGPEHNEDRYQEPDQDLYQDRYQDPHEEQHLRRYQHESPTDDQEVDDVHYPDLAPPDENEEQYQHDGSEEDEDEDIWQQEAHNQSAHSHRSPVTYDQHNDMAAGQGSSPWKNGHNNTPGEQGESSPDYWITKREKVPFLGQSRVKQLREQNVDLSGLLRAEDTPRRSRYYRGTSSPMSAAKSRPRQSSPSTKASQHDDVHGYVPENNLQSDDFLESSPRLSDDEAFQVDPTTRHENAWQLALAQRDQQRNEDIPGAAVTEQQSAHETHGITPERAQNPSAEVPPSSLFRRIASLTPRWLKAPIRGSPKRPSPPIREESSEAEEPEPGQEEDDEVDAAAAAVAATEDKEEEAEEREEDEELPVEPARFDDGVDGETGDNQEMEETPRPQHQVTRKGLDRHSSATPLPGQMLDHERASPDVGTTGETYERQLPLAVSGYFSDDHYTFLRRLYRLAKRHPERFPFHPSAGRAGIIGDWIWTSDGVHGVPITERQFAIIDRFVQELAKADLQAGGTGQVGWTEADVHRRLISIIIGEEIREERKAGMQGQWSAESSRTRATAARSWR